MIASSRQSLPIPPLERMPASMWNKVLQLLAVSCRHRHISQPFSAVSSSRLHSGHRDWESISQSEWGLYVVCLDCGKRFAYDWSRMRVMK